MRDTLRQLLPSRDDYRGVHRTLRTDLMAGITVGIVALPLALAFGVSSGVGAEAGLITAIVAGLVAAVFGGSNVQVSGPTGAMVVVLAPIVATHGAGAVVIVSLLAGLIVLVAGVLRWGRAVSTIPWPVIEGFTAGIGIIIFLQQVPTAFGASASNHTQNAGISAVESIMGADWPTALLPLAVVAAVVTLMLVLGRFLPRVPGSFVAILVVSVITSLVAAPLATIGTLPHSLPAPELPVVEPGLIGALIAPAFAVAALAALESLLSARVAASIGTTGTLNPDRELVGQGLASVASGLFGGMPATGAIARTAVNVRAGARSRLAAITHAILLLLIVLVLADIVSAIPLAALAGVLMVTAARMVSFTTLRRVFQAGRSNALLYVATAAITVSFDLVIAVGIGVAAAAFFALRSLSRASGAHREQIPGPSHPGDDRIALYRIEGSLFFGASDRVLEEITADASVSVVILRLSGLQLVDATGANALAEFISAAERRGITVLIKGVRPEHRGVLESLGVQQSLRHPEHVFTDLEPALDHARSHIDRESIAGD